MTILGNTGVAHGRMIIAADIHRARYRFETLFAPARAPLPGGYGVCEPPDPIPNSAVKPDSADGTIAQAMEE
jgi:hypothetical protein